MIMCAENALGFQKRQTDTLMTDLLFRILSWLNKHQTNKFLKLSIKHVLLLMSLLNCLSGSGRASGCYTFWSIIRFPTAGGSGADGQSGCKIAEVVSTWSSFSKYSFSKCSVDLWLKFRLNASLGGYFPHNVGNGDHRDNIKGGKIESLQFLPILLSAQHPGPPRPNLTLNKGTCFNRIHSSITVVI